MGNDSLSTAKCGRSFLPVLGCGLCLATLVVAGACLFRWLNAALPGKPERALQVIAGIAGLAIVLPVGAYLFVQRKNPVPARAGLVALAAVGTVLGAFYLTWVSYYVQFPADILIWSEGDFVNDIVKFRIGYPLYTDPQNNDSFHYTPGAQLLTYGLASLCGAPNSIPVYRLIQLVYNLAAAVIALGCYWRLTQLSGVTRLTRDRVLWGAVALPVLFLIGANSITNPFAHNLHNDALAQLITVTAYWLLLDYALKRRGWTLVLMVLIPAGGFFVKQSLAAWIGLYAAYLLFFDTPRSLLRTAGFILASSICLALLLAGCYSIWGAPFWYWTVREMAGHAVSPMRSFQHLLAAWPYYGVGLLAALVMLRGRAARPLLGVWLIWLSFFLLVTYTSGIEFMLNHLGAGCLLAGIWFLAALTRVWVPSQFQRTPRLRLSVWTRAGIAVVVVCLAYAGLGLVWVPINPLPGDAYRYVGEIERECSNLPPDKVLLDLGAWIRARRGLVSRDQVPSIGSRGSSQVVGDFSGILGRLRSRHYDKILVHSLDAPDFRYDNRTGWWSHSTGIRDALRQNYEEIGRIREVEGEKRFLLFSFEPVPWGATRYNFQEIVILAPKPAGSSLPCKQSEN